MCVSNAPADFSGTRLYIGEADHDLHGRIHVLCYENTAVSHSTAPNSMILHFPAAHQMNQENILDTSACPNILRDMEKAVRPRTRGGSFRGGISRSVVVFQHGIYHIALGNAADIPAALDQIPQNKRPALNEQLFNYYGERFPGWQVALCCFDNREAKKADPMMWWYTPSDPTHLHAPGIDCHTGEVPDEKAIVDVDTWLMLGSHRQREGYVVDYTDSVQPDVKAFLPYSVIGERFGTKLPNGDFITSVTSLLAGEPEIRRELSNIK